MSTIEDAELLVDEPAGSVGRGATFWVCRYLPAEVAGTAALILAGIGATAWSRAPLVVAIAAVLGESVGFFLVLAITISLEHAHEPSTWRRTAARTGRLLVAGLGAAWLLDILILRPGAVALGVWLLPDPVWGLLAGKLVADVFFYSVVVAASERAADRSPRGSTVEHAA